MKLIIGNKNYSSWSLRGWLAAKQSGLSFEEITVNISGEDWEEAKKGWADVQPSSGKVPILWDGEVVIWDSLAILEYLDDKVREESLSASKAAGIGSRFWPRDPVARGLCRSMVAEMHSAYQPLRREMPMNVRRRVEGIAVSDEARGNVVRILSLWAEARSRFGSGGPFLFGSYSAADIFYAPVVSRFMTYGVGVPKFAETYMEAIWEHDWMQEWIAGAEDEDWRIEAFEIAAE
ncbi:glutathione S-transferase family protein [Croceicoccus marinus]|jgi:glutathione S-transferase|uniref:Glutathione S-transferase family protein n=1 Tax=Croceicoccus marinus TaxID=450378 RepID=A0A7G6VVF9_9SPHN|nr:glutathione S-transferase family protein [Croceicoccus marinus]QNE05724.1 glutathione S-transferase family protein [Croceicoccus marinus]